MKATELQSNHTIGGSEVAAALGLSPWVSPYTLWARKTGRVDPEPDNERFRAGRLAEKYILELAEISPEQEQLTICIGSARGTIDATVSSTVIELKTTGYLWETPPMYYQVQLQWYMGLYHLQTGIEPQGVLIAINGNFNLRRYQIPFDKDLFNALDEKAGEWIQKHLIEGVEPAMNADELGGIQPKKQRIKLSNDVSAIIAQAKELKARICEIEAQLKPLDEAIRLAIGENEEAELPDGTVVTWKGYTRTMLDSKALQAEMPEIFNKYSKTTNYRILKL